MSHKHKQHPQKTQAKSTRLPLDVPAAAEALRRQIKSLLADGKHREAIRLGRELTALRSESGDEALLAEAFRGRAMAMAGKDLNKDALVILDNMETACPLHPPPPSWRFGLLVRLGRHAEAARWFSGHRHEMAEAQRHRAEEYLACCLLLGQDGLQEIFPLGSPMAAHVAAAAAALAAMDSGDSSTIRAALQGIGLRSPLRHLRLLLAALSAEDAQQCSQRLDRIPADSCFFPLSRLARLLGFAADFSPALVPQTPPGMDKAAELLLGLKPAALFLLKQLATAGDDAASLLRLLQRHGQGLTPSRLKTVKEQLLLYLPHELKRQTKNDIKVILDPTALQNLVRLCALSADVVYLDPLEAGRLWGELAQRMNPQDDDERLAKALILRRAADLLQKVEGEHPKGIFKLLHDSLLLDPVDSPSWLALVRLVKTYGNLNDAYRLLQEAVEKLPHDVNILLLSLEDTVRRGALKKAEGFAKRLLAIDPINVQAKQLLARAGLGHGRKQALLGKLALARKQFQAAKVGDRQHFFQGRPLICEGIALLAAGDETGGRELLARGQAAAVSPFFGSLLTVIETYLFKRPLSSREEAAESLRRQALAGVDRGDIPRVAGWLNREISDDGQDALELSTALAPVWQAASTFDWSIDEGLLLCRACRRRRYFNHLALLARHLSRQWPQHHELTVLTIQGKSHGGAKGLSAQDRKRLEDLLMSLPPHGPLFGEAFALLLADDNFSAMNSRGRKGRKQMVRDMDIDRDEAPEFLLGDPPSQRGGKPPAKPAQAKDGSEPRQMSLFDTLEKR